MRCVVEPTDGRGTDTVDLGRRLRLVRREDHQLGRRRASPWTAWASPRPRRASPSGWTRKGIGEGTVNFRLRDWLFSRQRYWGEPFPIVYDEDGVAHALPESMLPLELPEVEDYSPRTFDPDDADTSPETPLSRNEDWVNVDAGPGRRPRPATYRRETNTMPNWAGSCWYELRYLDPHNSEQLVDPAIEQYWMGPREGQPHGGVDLYVGGAEHAVLHLLYARFWSKVLFDLGHVSSAEPFHKLFNQGMIQAYVYRDSRGIAVPAAEVEERDGAYYYQGEKVTRRAGQDGQVPEERRHPGRDLRRVRRRHAAPVRDGDGPAGRLAAVGHPRGGRPVPAAAAAVAQRRRRGRPARSPSSTPSPTRTTLRALHKAIDGVAPGPGGPALQHRHRQGHRAEQPPDQGGRPGAARRSPRPLVLLVAPLAPHIAEELWRRLGHTDSVVHQDFPVADPAYVVDETVTCVVQIKGKVKARLEVSPSISDEELEKLALADEKVVRGAGRGGDPQGDRAGAEAGQHRPGVGA